MDIRYLVDPSKEYFQLSPFFIFSEDIEFQNHKFKCLYIFLESLKIEDIEKRQEFLEYYLDISKIKELFKLKNGKLNYSKQFNKKDVEEITFNNVKLKPMSPEFCMMFRNLFLVICAKNLSFKYSYLSLKCKDIEFSELDELTSLKYLDSKSYSTLLKM